MRVASDFRHIPELDGIRALAVGVVMASHAGLQHKVPGGFGVTVFFFLSGYLITSLLRIEFVKTRTIDFRAFYLRRVLRIMPPLYITLVILTALSSLGIFGTPVNWRAVPWDYLFLSNYSIIWNQTGGLPSPLWSLAIEEHFYLLFPLFFLAVIRKCPRMLWVGSCLIAVCLLVIFVRFASILSFPGHISEIYFWTHTRIDSILFGSILAVYHNPIVDEEAWRPNKWQVAFALLLLMATFVISSEVFRQTWRYSMQGVALYVLFSFVLSRRSARLNSMLRSKPLVWIGLLSYTLYLCHMAVFKAVETIFHLGPLAAGVVGVPIALLYAQLMRSWVEVPILAWRRRHVETVKSIDLPPLSVTSASESLGPSSTQQI